MEPNSLQPGPDEEFEPYHMEYVHRNLSILDFNRSCLSMVSGTASGILGLTGYQGFLFYILCSLSMSFLIYILKVIPSNRHPNKLFVSPGWALLYHGVVGGLLSHILFWTLFYGIVYVYI